MGLLGSKIGHSAIIVILLISSPKWMPLFRSLFLESTGQLNGVERSKEDQWISSRELRKKTYKKNSLDWYKEELRKTRIELDRLKREVRIMNQYRKLVGQDLKYLQVEVVGEFYRKQKDVWMINAGDDMQVRKNDLLIQNGVVVGTVWDVARTCALAEDMTSLNRETFAVIEGQTQEVLMVGEGQGRATIKVHKEGLGKIIGKSVFLSRAYSLGKHLILGKIVQVEDRQIDGWIHLIVRGYKVHAGKIFHVIQDIEKKSPSLFEDREELAVLKARIRDMEQRKLAMELLKN